MKVPFLDLKAQYLTIKDEIDHAIAKVIESTAFARGPFVEQFEQEFAEFCQCNYSIGVSSGTSALWLAMQALGIGPGDEVITVPNTFIATVEAITFCGATPVFVDIDEKTYTIDPNLIEAAITPKTKAIVPVHLFGQMADMDSIMEIARTHNLLVIEDAAQAHGAEYKGRKAGSIGDVGCFSFYPGKNLGAYGEAGAVVTNNSELASRIRMFSDHGQSAKYMHSFPGWNARMDGIQGAVLSVKLKHLPAWNEARRSHAQEYNRQLSDLENLILPFEADYGKHVYHVYAIRTSKRDKLLQSLKEHDIYCGIHYPIPVHLTDAYRNSHHKNGSLEISEKCAGEFLSLPMYAEMNSNHIDRIYDELRKF